MTDFSGLKILIVDNNSFIAKTLSSILDAFYVRKIIFCKTLKEAEKRYYERKVDCIFIDFMMENRSGLDLVKTIRSNQGNKKTPELPIILVTGYTDLETVKRARDAGITEIIGKPFSPDQVFLKLDNAINNKRDFIEVDEYVGPSRRRHKVNKTDFKDDNDRRQVASDDNENTE